VAVVAILCVASLMARKNKRQKVDAVAQAPARKPIKKPLQKRIGKFRVKKKKVGNHFSSTLAALRTVKTRFLLILAVAWMAGIFYLSSVPGSGSYYEMSRVLFLERKGAHIFEYFILTLLFLGILRLELPKNRIRVLWLSAFLAISYAITDEMHQLFVFGRTGKATDILIDSIGILLACTLSFFLMSSKKK
jgi:VanZ family protein